ncbi:MAG: hypothetical protein GVY24_00865 [Planctomycetes bacterium]|nr:hypothetical protein [Planctomycetota bacterium]
MAGLLHVPLIAGAHAQTPRVSVDPYASVDWQNDTQHHGSFHNHTTESDGRMQPAEVIDAYHALGHDILALTDHNKVTWPWSAFDRDPDTLGMVAVRGNELSHHHHTLSLFSDLETDTHIHTTALLQVRETDGLSVLAHPGRYWELDEHGRVPDEVRDRYVALFTQYDNLIGMEVVNQGDRYPHDRALWDAVLTRLMPERTVWGMANDDSHGQAHIGLNTTVMMLDELDTEHVRGALEDGRFYFTTVTSHPKDQQSRAQTPTIRKITRDPDAHTISIHAQTNGEPLPDDRYRWFSAGGRVVHTGPTLDLQATEGLAKYVRAEIRGDGGTAYTQPFGLMPAQDETVTTGHRTGSDQPR